ncbi:response regulator [Streptacidiphilus jiangxiensis]|uniref:DNA-binding response regulator, NarL/FixJ family, contains REC and HTH domains n=1 Tax=Streptacidiphilus jiangxiensis TaxID=235985 RepID=A0A1H7VJR8_STRJI|nr:response regulator transcription factor [Streptacidiphilus jiangxiensis]SEM09095.1 DNA-binding response regulator, NarL/FixJ family, contains REC and HTH domains [Streptacidiphilus jiangxiensis]
MRVVVAEDTAILRVGLVQLLEDEGHEVVAAVADGVQLLAAAAEHEPDAVVSDVRMPPSHTDEGLRAVIELRARRPGLPVLIFSQYVETQYASRLLAGGSAGVGYLLKERVLDTRDFVDALERVAAGGTALDPEVVTQLVGASPVRGTIDGLSPREREVLGLMAQGRSNSAIARELVVTERAVEKHVANIFLKLDLPVSAADHRRVLAVLRHLGA